MKEGELSENSFGEISTFNLGWYWSENKQEHQLAKIAEKDRSTHFYVIGATGTGKSKFLEFLIQQDIEKGNGFAVIDPHGDVIESIKGYLAYRYDFYNDEEEINKRIILIDPTDTQYTVTFNPLEKVPNVSVTEQSGELITAFRKIWSDSWGVRMEDLMRHALIVLGEAGLTLLELPQLLTRRSFRELILSKVDHPLAKEYFQRFDTLTDRGQITWIEPVMNKINAFLSDDRLRQIFSSSSSTFNLREIMDQKKILLVKLNKGKLKGSADLLGSLLMAKIQMAAFSRAELPKSRRTPFYVYIDEFQNFAGESFGVILSEARKYGLSLIMAHQTLSQVPEELRSLILGNTGLQVYFRVNRHDASLLAKEAFQYSGYEIKSMSIYRGPEFWSLGEEWEHYTEALQGLPPRFCFAKHKIEGGVIPLETVEVDEAQDVLGMQEGEYSEFLKGIPFGKEYLIERESLAIQIDERQKLLRLEIEKALPGSLQVLLPEERKEEKKQAKRSETEMTVRRDSHKNDKLSSDEKGFLEFIAENPGIFVTKLYKALHLSGYKGDRMKESLLEKGYIVQEETREGAKGRLAKLLVLTNDGRATLEDISMPGKGGDLHKHFQKMVKEQAELFGWKATIEERIRQSLETVDVGLSREDVRIAVEISSTTKAEQEIPNIRKCLEAGYDYIISACCEDEGVSLIKTEAKKQFTARERERIRFCRVSKVQRVLNTLFSPTIVSEKGIVSGRLSKEKQLLGTTEAAEFLGIKKNTLYEWIIQRKIPHLKVGRLVKFKKDELESWLEKRKQNEEHIELV